MNRMDELPTESIISFLKVKLDSHKTIFDFPCIKAVEKLVDDYLILCNPSAWYESRLAWRDYLVQKRS